MYPSCLWECAQYPGSGMCGVHSFSVTPLT